MPLWSGMINTLTNGSTLYFPLHYYTLTMSTPYTCLLTSKNLILHVSPISLCKNKLFSILLKITSFWLIYKTFLHYPDLSWQKMDWNNDWITYCVVIWLKTKYTRLNAFEPKTDTITLLVLPINSFIYVFITFIGHLLVAINEKISFIMVIIFYCQLFR